MCSGCFGEYEDGDDLHDDVNGAERSMIYGDGGKGREVERQTAERFEEQCEILVSAEFIAEIYRVNVTAQKPQHLAGSDRLDMPQQGTGRYKRSLNTSAKHYQTMQSAKASGAVRVFGGGKALIMLGLTAVPLGLLAIWLLLG